MRGMQRASEKREAEVIAPPVRPLSPQIEDLIVGRPARARRRPRPPPLEIDRMALTFGDAPVEWRFSPCDTASQFYRRALR